MLNYCSSDSFGSLSKKLAASLHAVYVYKNVKSFLGLVKINLSRRFPGNHGVMHMFGFLTDIKQPKNNIINLFKVTTLIK